MKKLLLSVLMFAVCAAFADDKSAKPQFRVGVNIGFPPMVYAEKGKIVGLEVDFAKKFCEENGYELVLINMDFKELIPALNAKRVDAVMSAMSYTDTRAKRVAFTKSYLTVSQMPLLHRIDFQKYDSALSVINAIGNIGVIERYTAETFVKDNFYYCNVVVLKDSKDAIEALLAKKIDMLVADSTLVMWLAGNFESSGIAPMPIVLDKELLCWAVRQDNPKLLAALNQFIDTHRKDGSLDKMIKAKIPYYDEKIYIEN